MTGLLGAPLQGYSPSELGQLEPVSFATLDPAPSRRCFEPGLDAPLELRALTAQVVSAPTRAARLSAYLDDLIESAMFGDCED